MPCPCRSPPPCEGLWQGHLRSSDGEGAPGTAGSVAEALWRAPAIPPSSVVRVAAGGSSVRFYDTHTHGRVFSLSNLLLTREGSLVLHPWALWGGWWESRRAHGVGAGTPKRIGCVHHPAARASVHSWPLLALPLWEHVCPGEHGEVLPVGPLTSGWASVAGSSAGFPTSPALSPLSIHPREHILGELLAPPGSSASPAGGAGARCRRTARAGSER